MNDTVAFPPTSSLTALRGAVGEVVGAGDPVGCWARAVWLWRIFMALDGLIAVLWGIVDRIAAGEMVLEGRCPVAAVPVLGERPAGAGFGPVRRRVRRRVLGRAVAGVPAVAGRRVVAAAVASAGRAHVRFGREACGRRGRGLVGVSPGVSVRGRWVSNGGWGAAQTCAVNVPVNHRNVIRSLFLLGKIEFFGRWIATAPRGASC